MTSPHPQASQGKEATMTEVTKEHRLAVARAWDGHPDIDGFRLETRRWAQTGLVVDSDSAGLERLAQLVADAEGAWIPVEGSAHGGQASIGYDRFYNRVGECEGNGTRLVFVDGQKDDCDITHWRPFPPPPAMEKP